MRRLLAVLVATAALTVSVVPAAQAATATRKCSAYSCPAIMTNIANWAPSIAPPSLYLGNGYAPYLTGLGYPVYTHRKAIAHGILHAAKTSCLKRAGHPVCRMYKIKVTVTFGATKWHKGSCGCQSGYFYSSMAWSYKGSGYAAPKTWRVNKNGYWVNIK